MKHRHRPPAYRARELSPETCTLVDGLAELIARDILAGEDEDISETDAATNPSPEVRA